METKLKSYRSYDEQFKLTLLIDYYASGKSKNFICRKYGIDISNFIRWERYYSSESLSLPSELLDSVSQLMASKTRHQANLCSSKNKEEELQEEIARLRKALSYSELRNEALNEVLKIGKETYGIDLLKKAGAKQ